MVPFTKALQVFEKSLSEAGRTERTKENHLGVIRRLDRTIGLLHENPEELSARLSTWRAKLRRDHAASRISRSKVRGEVSTLRLFYDALVLHGMLPSNPAGHLKGMPRDRWMPRPITGQQLVRLFEAADPWVADALDPIRLRDRAVLGLLFCGLRRIEVCRLQLRDLEYHAADLTLQVQVLGKGNKRGVVPCVPSSATWLALHVLEQHARDEYRQWVQEVALDPRLDPEEQERQSRFNALDRLLATRLQGSRQWLFSVHGRPLHPRTLNRIFAHYRRAAQLPPDIGPHRLRHTCATMLLNRGVDIRVVQKLLRHESIAVTQMYTEVSTSLAASAMRQLEGQL